MITLPEILKYADHIGKEPNEPQSIKLRNTVMIALRLAYEAGMEYQKSIDNKEYNKQTT